jgi:hypothetical protein
MQLELELILTHIHIKAFNVIPQQGITNTLALPIGKMLYIYLLCPHSEHQKKSVPI